MLEYLKKFKSLPTELQQVIASPKASVVIKALEKKYQVDLDILVIKLMIKEISWNDLVSFLVSEYSLSTESAESLRTDLVEQLFFNVKIYLGIQDASIREDKTANFSAINKEIGTIQNIPAAEFEQPKKEVYFPSTAKARESVSNQREITLAKKNNDFNIEKNALLSLDEQVENIFLPIMQAARITDADSVEGVRLKNIIKTSLKGIRDLLDTRETLIKAKEEGGLGIEAAKADEIVKILKQQKNSSSFNGVSTPLIKNNTSPFDSLNKMRDVEYVFQDQKKDSLSGNDFNKLSARTDAKPEEKTVARPAINKPREFSAEDLKHEIAPPPPAIIKKQESLGSVDKQAVFGGDDKNAKVKNNFVISPEKIKQAEEALRQSTRANSSGGMLKNQNTETMAIKRVDSRNFQDKSRMDDILKPLSKLQGPIEELSGLDLTKFRRLGDSPLTIIKKIESKIKLLESEGFTKRQQGASAWRHSRVYQEYISLGQESFSQGRPIESVIKKRQQDNIDTLTIDEFNAIVELNAVLRV